MDAKTLAEEYLINNNLRCTDEEFEDLVETFDALLQQKVSTVS